MSLNLFATPPSYLYSALLASCILYIVFSPGRRARTLPPGPPTLPIIGNLHQIPKTGAHFKFTEWAQEYGGIFSLKLGSATVVVITDRSIVKELIDKKSSIYSDRPASYVSQVLITGGDHALVMSQGDKWRKFRKVIHQHFNEGRCEKQHIKLQNAEAVQMMRDFMLGPEDLMWHPKRYSNSITMATLYHIEADDGDEYLVFGIRSSTVKAPHFTALYELLEEWSKVMEPGATPPVDIFPFLNYLPERLFNNWRTRCSNVGRAMDKLYGGMVTRVKARRLRSGSRDSFLDNVLDQQDKLQLSRNELNFLCGVLMEGGSDTSSSIILAFIHAMLKYPDVQKEAQMEIDGVVGEERSPVWADFGKLPYVNMIVKETMRWRPVTPLAFPHATSEADTINNFTIPAKTTVFINTYGLHHAPVSSSSASTSSHPTASTPSTPNPSPELLETFHPLRHLPIALRSAADLATSPQHHLRDHYGYGSGRRLCPGIHLAERNLWLAVAKLCWGFEFRERSEQRVDAGYRTGYSEGFLVCAKEFGCEVLVRSEKRKETILREMREAENTIFAGFEDE